MWVMGVWTPVNTWWETLIVWTIPSALLYLYKLLTFFCLLPLKCLWDEMEARTSCYFILSVWDSIWSGTAQAGLRLTAILSKLKSAVKSFRNTTFPPDNDHLTKAHKISCSLMETCKYSHSQLSRCYYKYKAMKRKQGGWKWLRHMHEYLLYKAQPS